MSILEKAKVVRKTLMTSKAIGETIYLRNFILCYRRIYKQIAPLNLFLGLKKALIHPDKKAKTSSKSVVDLDKSYS